MLTQKEIKQIEKLAIVLKKYADNQSYNPPSRTKVQLSPTRRYNKEIFLLCVKTKIGANVEKGFTELDRLHKEYESWRAKTLTEDNEEKFRTLVDCLKGTRYDLADTLQQLAQIERDELSSEKSAETKPENKDAKREREWLIQPKPPEIFQKILWIQKYGIKHWKLVSLAILIVLCIWILSKINLFSYLSRRVLATVLSGTKKSAFFVIFLLTIFDNMLKYLYVSQQTNINRQ